MFHTQEGITVGLIDSLICISRALLGRKLLTNNPTQAVQEALEDLRNNNDVRLVLTRLPIPEWEKLTDDWERLKDEGIIP